ncbi:MAG: S16 family serine protease [Candidatus Woesearchaeota archaeon]
MSEECLSPKARYLEFASLNAAFLQILISTCLVSAPMKLLAWITVIALLASSVFAQSGSIKLLALAEDSSGKESGAVADLDLRVESGSNRVYLETFPLTKITTQISMRFAQQVACRELDIDCSDKDFYFTIKALPSIVGGPSAGSAAGILVASLIAGLELRNDTAITGTINSGGIIGPVGGLKEKIGAAAEAGLSRVLIPGGTANLTDSTTNTTIDLIAYGKVLGIEVVEVSTIIDALEEYTGRNFSRAKSEFSIEKGYEETMRQIAIDLCNRTQKINVSLESHRSGKNTTEIELAALNMSTRAKDVFNASQYYASASFCFRTNVGLKQAWALQRNWTTEGIAKALRELKERIGSYSSAIDARNITSLTDLQTYMAVKERISEAESVIEDVVKNKTDTENLVAGIAYAEERLFSAKTWARFFDNNDTTAIVDRSGLRDACISKISEAEERYQYAKLYFPKSLEETVCSIFIFGFGWGIKGAAFATVLAHVDTLDAPYPGRRGRVALIRPSAASLDRAAQVDSFAFQYQRQHPSPR